MSDEKVIAIDSNKGVIKELEYLLDAARKGKVVGIAVVTIHSDGCAGNCAMVANEPLLALGELSVLMREVQDLYVDLRLHNAGARYDDR